VQWGDRSTVAFSRHLGLDIMDFYLAPIRSRQRSVHVDQRREGDRLTTTWHTRLGELRQVQQFSAETGLSYTVEHQVKEPADLGRLAEVFADQEFWVDAEGATATRERAALVGEGGIVVASMPGTPLGQMVRVHCGVEGLAYLWADAREGLRALFGVMEANHLRQFQLAASVDGLDGLIGMDDTSTTTISPAMFEEFCLSYTDRVADATHAGGKFYLHHSCGLIRDILDLYRQTKMDAVHAYTTPPIGNATIAFGREHLGGRIVIIVSLDELFRDMSDRAGVAASIARRFDEAGSAENFIVVVAADPGKTMEETAFVAGEARKHQRRLR